MPEDKRKMLQALAAKRKADNEAGGRKKPKEAAAVGVVTERKDFGKAIGGGKVQQQRKSSPVNKGKEKAKALPKKKVVEPDSGADTSEEEAADGSGESDEEDVSGESEEEDVADSENSEDSDVPKKKKPVAKPVVKAASAKKGKGVAPVAKGKDVKGKKKADSDDSGAENGVEDDDSELSEDPLDEVNPDNILSSRTRRRTAQPVNYDFGSGDLDEDDDSDED